jgi:hypothetical protein
MAPETILALDRALPLGAAGLRCFPCASNKQPTTPHGFHDAECDPTALRILWDRYPGPLVAIATGAPSGLGVLDFDRKHPEAWQWLGANRYRLPETRAHRTRSNGLHLIFRHQPGMRCWTRRHVKGIDGRADGGFAIWWPAAGLPVLCEAAPAQWPSWLLGVLQHSTSPVRSGSRVMIPDQHALAGLVRKVARAAEGERNTITFWAACRAGEMAASGLISAEYAAAVIANAAMVSGLPSAEANQTAWSGIRTGLGASLCTREPRPSR